MRVSVDVRNEIFKWMIESRRYVNTMRLDEGIQALEFNGVPIIWDAALPKNTIIVQQTGSLVAADPDDVAWTPYDTLDL